MSKAASSRKHTMAPFRSHGLLSLWAVLSAVWMIANSTLAVAVVLLGAAITLPIAWLLEASGNTWNRIRWTPDGFLHFSLYGATFLVELVKANVNMMRYVYSSRVDVKPGIVKVRTRLKSPIGRLALANTIALTPGSLVMEMRGDALFIHLLDIGDIDPDALADAIVRPFEKHLEHVFG